AREQDRIEAAEQAQRVLTPLLDPATAAEVHNAIAGGGVTMTLGNLQTTTVSHILSDLADQVPAEQFQKVADLLVSKGLIERVAEPRLCVRAGQPIQIGGGGLTLDLRPEVLDGGQAVQLNVEASLDTAKSSSRDAVQGPIAAARSLRSSGRVKVPNERHGVLLLGGMAPATNPADASTYCLIFRATVLPPVVQPEVSEGRLSSSPT
ncbi:MAG: hypothetical protein ACM3VT_13840, partial [Solirubrobacterales bacterium]